MSMRRALFFGILMLLSTFQAHGLDVPPHTGPVVDLADVFTPGEEQQLSASLLQFQRQHGPQLQIFTVPTLAGEPIEAYSIKVTDRWKLGDQKRDDGVLLLFSDEDRQVRIEVGQGLEGPLPDVLTGRIVRDVMLPFFKEGQYSAGLVSGMNAVANRLGGTLQGVPVATSARSPQHRQRSPLASFLFLMILFFFILPRLSGRGRRRGLGGFLSGMLLGGVFGSHGRRHGSGGWGGFGRGGGFGGGGFGGGGGGGFSGGGASGRW
ncbi:MAG TPA: TPM domain-containing protein [Bdellovibrionota bacterium]|nr:TPM domain-containing protein [Bdellovibrionota bacterium]